ncbi:MAG: hypothetical protein KA383_09895 [Phycisphaerae bacterium]|nr:hypothetical protein [Phycisphaerae bacterium]
MPESTEAAELHKLRALAALAARHGAAVLNAQRIMVRLLLAAGADGTATIDAVRGQLGELDGRPTWLGAVPHGLRAAGLIEPAGFATSARRVSHARPVSVWRLRDADRARRWLAAAELGR